MDRWDDRDDLEGKVKGPQGQIALLGMGGFVKADSSMRLAFQPASSACCMQECVQAKHADAWVLGLHACLDHFFAFPQQQLVRATVRRRASLARQYLLTSPQLLRHAVT